MLGFKSADGGGQPVGKFTEDDFDKSKRQHVFPDGVKHLKMFRAEEIECSVFISDEVTSGLEASEKQRAKAAQESADKKQALTKEQSAVISAQKRIRDTARARNDLMGRLHEAKAELRNLELTPDSLVEPGGKIVSLRSKNHLDSVVEIKKLVFGDPDKKVEGLETKVASAVAEYDKAVAEYEAFILEKLSPPAKSQLVEA